MCLLDQTAFNGSATKYPFLYKTFNTTSIKQLVRGEEYPYTLLELDHNNDSKDWIGYHGFLQATGNMVTSDDWGRGRLYHVCV